MRWATSSMCLFAAAAAEMPGGSSKKVFKHPTVFYFSPLPPRRLPAPLLEHRFRRNKCVARVCRETSVEQGALCFRLSSGVGRTTPAKRADIPLKFDFGPMVMIVPCLLSLLTFFCQRRAAVASQ